MHCPPRPHVINTWPPAGNTASEGYTIFWRWDLLEVIRTLEGVLSRALSILSASKLPQNEQLYWISRLATMMLCKVQRAKWPWAELSETKILTSSALWVVSVRNFALQFCSDAPVVTTENLYQKCGLWTWVVGGIWKTQRPGLEKLKNAVSRAVQMILVGAQKVHGKRSEHEFLVGIRALLESGLKATCVKFWQRIYPHLSLSWNLVGSGCQRWQMSYMVEEILPSCSI